MTRFSVRLLVVAVLSSACGGAVATSSSVPTASPATTAISAPTPARTTLPARLDDQVLAAAVRASPFTITDVLVYTADTDTNKLLGRPGQYIGKVSWNDPRVTSKNYDTTVELFGDRASMDARFAYLDAIIKSGPVFLQYMYRNDVRLAILRVPKDLTPIQAQAYADWFAKL